MAEWSVSEFVLVTATLHPNRRKSPDSRCIVGPHQCPDRFDIDTKTTDKDDRDRRQRTRTIETEDVSSLVLAVRNMNTQQSVVQSFVAMFAHKLGDCGDS